MGLLTDLPLRPDDEETAAAHRSLAALYPDRTRIAGVAGDFGITMTMLADGVASLDLWWDVLNELSRSNRIPALLRKVTTEFHGSPSTALMRKILAQADRTAPQVVVFGHPLRASTEEVTNTRNALIDTLRQRGIRVEHVDDRWAVSLDATVNGPAFVAQPVPPLLLHPCSARSIESVYRSIDALDWSMIMAKLGARLQRVPYNLVCAVTGDGGTLSSVPKISDVVLGPSKDSEPTCSYGSIEELSQWIGTQLKPADDRSAKQPPAFGYEGISQDVIARAGHVDIFMDSIVPKASKPLKDLEFLPPELEAVPFLSEEQAEAVMRAMAKYPCGIVALHSFGSGLDEEGRLPDTFVERLKGFEGDLQRVSADCGLDHKLIIRVGIVNTTVPEDHRYRYLRKETDDTIAKWRFIPVVVADGKPHEVSQAHLDLLTTELRGLLQRVQATAGGSP